MRMVRRFARIADKRSRLPPQWRGRDDEFVGAAPLVGGMAAVPRMPDMPPSARGVRGFWLRFLRSHRQRGDGIGFVLILIPLIFLTGLADSSARSILTKT